MRTLLRHTLRAAAGTATAIVCALTAVPAATAAPAPQYAPTASFVIGQNVCHQGAVGGLRCGRILAVNATINLGGGNIIYGVAQSTACSVSGDVGGPVYAGSTLVGKIVHATGCPFGYSYYKPLGSPLTK
ncbi:hypothetical protein [Streptomyces sp. NPDC020965]|uniref:hypothetical protein n=1 Tax=Streptomyces sp. NPDC020965 TaxID=3365105 RepID=UPI0037A236BF